MSAAIQLAKADLASTWWKSIRAGARTARASASAGPRCACSARGPARGFPRARLVCERLRCLHFRGPSIMTLPTPRIAGSGVPGVGALLGSLFPGDSSRAPPDESRARPHAGTRERSRRAPIRTGPRDRGTRHPAATDKRRGAAALTARPIGHVCFFVLLPTLTSVPASHRCARISRWRSRQAAGPPFHR